MNAKTSKLQSSRYFICVTHSFYVHDPVLRKDVKSVDTLKGASLECQGGSRGRMRNFCINVRITRAFGSYSQCRCLDLIPDDFTCFSEKLII